METKRTVEIVLNLETGAIIEAEELFQNPKEREPEIFQLRTALEKGLKTQNVIYVCLYCKQPVAIRGRTNFHSYTKHYYFTHPYKSDDCPIKTQTKYTKEQTLRMKYNGEKESLRHYNLKTFIGQYLEKTPEVTDVLIDKVYKDEQVSSEWKKPDVMATYQDKKIAFELQLSTTFLTVIVARTLFYQEHNVFLIWIFADFSLDSDLQKFMQKDVYYNNNFNVYVLDREAQAESERQNQLIIKCFYQCFYPTIGGIATEWKSSLIKISELQYNSQDISIYFYDSVSNRREALRQYNNIERERFEEFHKKIASDKVATCVAFLRQFHQYDQYPSYLAEDNPFQEIATSEEIIQINQKIRLAGANSEVLTKLFFERRKPNFLKFLCTEPKIEIDTNLIHRNDKSVLREIYDIDNISDFRFYLSCLFSRPNSINEEDSIMLKNAFKKNQMNLLDIQRDRITKWVYINLMQNLSSREMAFEIWNYEKLLSAIASLKYKIVVDSRLTNLIQVIHNFLHSHAQYGRIFIETMKTYGEYEKHLQPDKEGKLKAKIEAVFNNRIPQDTRFDSIIYEVFPEMF